VVWYPQRTICYADMAATAARWMYDDLHSEESGMRYHDGSHKVWSRHRSAAFPFDANDGVSIWVSTEDLTPDDNFLGEPEAHVS
jgi:hypothetical protein